MRGIDKSRVAASFDKAAVNYERYAVLQKTVAERLSDRLELVKLNPSCVIDMGSGTGTSSRLLAGKYHKSKIIQFDIARQMLLASRSRSPRFFSRHRFICGDAEALPVVDSCAGLVFSSLTIQWCNDLDRLLSEVNRVLSPGGLIIFATLGPDTLKELRQSWLTADADVHINTFLDMHDIGDAIIRAGMDGVVMDVEMITMTYESCMDLMRELKNLGAHNANLDRNIALTGKGKLNRVIEAYESYRQDGKVPASFEIVYGHAWKSLTDKRRLAEKNISYIPIKEIQK